MIVRRCHIARIGNAKFFYSFDGGSAVSNAYVEYKGSMELKLAKISELVAHMKKLKNK